MGSTRIPAWRISLSMLVIWTKLNSLCQVLIRWVLWWAQNVLPMDCTICQLSRGFISTLQITGPLWSVPISFLLVLLAKRTGSYWRSSVWIVVLMTTTTLTEWCWIYTICQARRVCCCLSIPFNVVCTSADWQCWQWFGTFGPSQHYGRQHNSCTLLPQQYLCMWNFGRMEQLGCHQITKSDMHSQCCY